MLAYKMLQNLIGLLAHVLTFNSGPAVPVDQFLDSIGTQSAISTRGESFDRTVECVRFLGVHWMRAGIEGNVPISQLLDLHHKTGVKFSWGLGSGNANLEKLLSTAHEVAAGGALLSFEGPNEPNNWGIEYQGKKGGRDASWAPVAQLMRDLHQRVKADPILAKYPVWSISLTGAETDNVGLQFLKVPVGANCLFPAGTIFADYANVHNYIYHPNSPGVQDNKTWNSADPGPACRVDGLYGEFGQTWAHHYKGYSVTQLAKLPRVTTESGAVIEGAVTEEIQAKNLLTFYLDQFVRGWSYSANYLMRDRVDEAGNQTFGFFRPDYTPRKSAVYLHNLTTILSQSHFHGAPYNVSYQVDGRTDTVHDLILQIGDHEFALVVWNEQVSGVSNVQVRLAKAAFHVTQFDPTVGTSPIKYLATARSVELALTDHPIILRFNTKSL